MAEDKENRLSYKRMSLPIERLRQGFYTDQYFNVSQQLLLDLRTQGYLYDGKNARWLHATDMSSNRTLKISNLEVEAQIFNRHPRSLVVGVDHCLAILRHASGYINSHGQWVSKWEKLEVEAVEDGTISTYNNDPMLVKPVIKIRGRYLDFAILETPMLGILSRATRIATNVSKVLLAADDKEVSFFPARFDLPWTQEIDGYAYWVATQRLKKIPNVSTPAQASVWNGNASGTMPHSIIACFLADAPEAIKQIALFTPVDTPLVLLADFRNDVVSAISKTLRMFWDNYIQAKDSGDEWGQKRWNLFAVRLDTSGSLKDKSLPEGASKGVSAQLVHTVRDAIDNAYKSWKPFTWPKEYDAQNYCKAVKIIVSGGFNEAKVAEFVANDVPADIFAIGSHFLTNDKYTNTDYTMDIVRVKINNGWVPLAKIGRMDCTWRQLDRVNLGFFS